LIWDKQKDTDQIVCTSPNFELTAACGSPYNFDEEAKQLHDELTEVINEERARFDEYVKSSRHKGYKIWDDFRAAIPIYKPIKPG
jgi:hypothetical protein